MRIAKSDGIVTKKERKHIQHEQIHANRITFKVKHNHQKRK
jgi:uncharacterized membrane protein YebE (DUF533 family)